MVSFVADEDRGEPRFGDTTVSRHNAPAWLSARASCRGIFTRVWVLTNRSELLQSLPWVSVKSLRLSSIRKIERQSSPKSFEIENFPAVVVTQGAPCPARALARRRSIEATIELELPNPRSYNAAEKEQQ